MKKCLMIVCAMFCLSAVCSAQTKKTTTYTKETKETYVEEVCYPGTEDIMETRIWDSYDDFELSKKIRTSDGWVAGWGQSSGNLRKDETSAYKLKNTAQEMAYDQIAGQMAKEIVKKSTTYWKESDHNGLTDNINHREKGLQQQVKTELPAASKYCSYTI